MVIQTETVTCRCGRKVDKDTFDEIGECLMCEKLRDDRDDEEHYNESDFNDYNHY